MSQLYPLPRCRNWLLTALAGLLLGASSLSMPLQAAQAEGQLVMFTATWCASCRDVMPVIERTASEQGLSILLIDVDEPNAPKQASNKGLSIPVKELPQVYLLQSSRSSLVFDGDGYVLGHRSGAQQTLSSKVKQAIGQ